MRVSRMLGSTLAVALLFGGGASAADDLKSGRQEISIKKQPAFNPLHATGPQEGEKSCLV